MVEFVVRLSGVTETVLEKLTRFGIFKTRSEAIRAGILELGKEYQLFQNPKELEDELVAKKMQRISDEIKQGKRKLLTEEQVKKKYRFK